MLPLHTDVHNLFVVVAVSATHVRFNAIRVEPTWMILEQSAGVDAAMAAAAAAAAGRTVVRNASAGAAAVDTVPQLPADVHFMSVSSLQAKLVAQGAKLWL